MMKTKLRIHKWPEKILRQKSRKVQEIDSVIAAILEEMYVLMKANDGVGLASNQVGLGMQLVVIEAEGRTFKLVNPDITEREGSLIFKEGCLSFPGIELEVKRSRKIKVEALDNKGAPLSLELEGVLAVIFQHEIDHINGINFIDRVSFLQRLRILPKLRRIKKSNEVDRIRG